MTNPERTIDLRQYWEVFRSRKFAVIIPTLLVGALALLYTVSQTPQYTARATVRVDPLVIPLFSTPSKADQPDMPTEQQTASSTSVAAIARRSLRATASSQALLKHLHVAAVGTGNILVIQYTSASPQQAARYANAFAQAYLAYRNGSITTPLNRLIGQRRFAIAQLLAQIPHAGVVQRQALMSQVRENATQLAQFQSDRQLVSGGAVIQSALPPGSASTPKIARTVAIGLVGGLVAGICLAILMEGLDSRIKSREELEAYLRAPVLGVIPKLDRPKNGLAATATGRGASLSEACRMTGASLQHLAGRDGLRVIMILSPQPGSGRSTITANLGVVLAQAGHRVILVSADFRAPALHRLFGLSNEWGLSNALLEGRDAKALLQETTIPGLYVLASGAAPQNAAAALARPATEEIFSSLRTLAPSFILVDAPAPLAVSDSLVLASRVDGTVLIWNAEDRNVSALMGARDQLETAGANIVGGIYSFGLGKSKTRKARRRNDMARGYETPAEVSLRIRDAAQGSGRTKTGLPEVERTSGPTGN